MKVLIFTILLLVQEILGAHNFFMAWHLLSPRAIVTCSVFLLYSVLLQEALSVMRTIPEKEITKRRIRPFALAVAKSVQKAS